MAIISISDPLRSISPIRDPIHNYMSFTIFEREIIDSPFFQRLHFVLQNSAAYSVYPANKNSRYIHSLGVSHLCGRIFIHGLKNAQPEELRRFILAASEFIDSVFKLLNVEKRHQEQLEATWRKLINNSSRFQHKPPGADPIEISEVIPGTIRTPLFIINTFWLSLKICGLVHDIGHLPMSHLFEDALEDAAEIAALCGIEPQKTELLGRFYEKSVAQAFDPSDTHPEQSLRNIAYILGVDHEEIRKLISSSKFHEVRSLRIFDIIRQNSPEAYDTISHGHPGAKGYRDLILFLSKAILFASREGMTSNNSFLSAIRNIVASELDADRLDYTMRDPRSSGLELGTFDLDRIVSNFTLCRVDGNFVFAISEKATAAVESFFHQRYLMYSTLVYHRTAMRTKAVLRELLGRILVFCIDRPSHPISQIAERAGFVAMKHDRGSPLVDQLVPSDTRRLMSFDDSRLRSALFDIVDCLIDRKDLDTNEAWIKLLSETFLFRREQNVISFGKGNLESEEDLKFLDITDVNPFSISSSEGRAGLLTFVDDQRKKISAETGGRVALLFSETKPKVYKAESPVFVAVDAHGSTRRLEAISPYIAAQPSLAERERDFVISFVGSGLRDSADDVKICRECYEKILLECARIKRNAATRIKGADSVRSGDTQ